MRCEGCTYTVYDYSENVELCKFFGYGDDEISENRKGEIGCRYNKKTLDKFERISQEVDEPEIIRQMGDFAKFCEEYDKEADK